MALQGIAIGPFLFTVSLSKCPHFCPISQFFSYFIYVIVIYFLLDGSQFYGPQPDPQNTPNVLFSRKLPRLLPPPPPGSQKELNCHGVLLLLLVKFLPRGAPKDRSTRGSLHTLDPDEIDDGKASDDSGKAYSLSAYSSRVLRTRHLHLFPHLFVFLFYSSDIPCCSYLSLPFSGALIICSTFGKFTGLLYILLYWE